MGNSSENSPFPDTRWSKVRAAGEGSSSALEDLCLIYWKPLYCYVRRKGNDAPTAEDLIQKFFLDLLEKKKEQKDVVTVARQGEGKFRSFLLKSLSNFLTNERRWENAQIRGGGHKFMPLDFESAESAYRREPADNLTPERLLEKQWAQALLDRVLMLLREEVGECFDVLKEFLPYRATGDTSLAGAAEELGISRDAIAARAHRLRRRLRELLHAEIRETVDRPEDVDDEIRDLFRVFEAKGKEGRR